MNIQNDVYEALQSLHLNFRDRAFSGGIGQSFGKQTGSAVEFKDFRDYMPGDDIRLIDWAAYARSDRLTLRCYEEEINPYLEIIIDDSKSMAINADKSYTASALAHYLHLQKTHQTALFLSGDKLIKPPQRFPSIEFLAEQSIMLVDPYPCAMQMKKSGFLWLISDFLSPYSNVDVIRAMSKKAAQLVVVQILSKEEVDPPKQGYYTLIDAENQQQIQVYMSRKVREQYLKRLQRLQRSLRETCRQCGAISIEIIAKQQSIKACLLEYFAPLGMVEI